MSRTASAARTCESQPIAYRMCDAYSNLLERPVHGVCWLRSVRELTAACVHMCMCIISGFTFHSVGYIGACVYTLQFLILILFCAHIIYDTFLLLVVPVPSTHLCRTIRYGFRKQPSHPVFLLPV